MPYVFLVPLCHFVTKLFVCDELLVPRPTLARGPPLDGFPRLLIHYIRGYSSYPEAVCTIRKLRTRHAVVTRDPLKMEIYTYFAQQAFSLTFISGG
jgi:hypothetical protein